MTFWSIYLTSGIIRNRFLNLLKGIKKNNSGIIIHFLHYKSLEEAANKWIERGKRINYNNLFIIWHNGSVSGPDKESFERFQTIPQQKLLITGSNFNYNDENVVKLKLYGKNYFPGKILIRKSKYSAKRFLDEVDYVSWLNRCNDFGNSNNTGGK